MNISRSIKSNDIISDNYSFSPDGQKIIFTSDRQGSKNIYIMNANGANQIALTKNEFDNYNPSFSPFSSYTFPLYLIVPIILFCMKLMIPDLFSPIIL